MKESEPLAHARENFQQTDLPHVFTEGSGIVEIKGLIPFRISCCSFIPPHSSAHDPSRFFPRCWLAT